MSREVTSTVSVKRDHMNKLLDHYGVKQRDGVEVVGHDEMLSPEIGRLAVAVSEPKRGAGDVTGSSAAPR